MSNVIYSINGPIITVRDTRDFSMLEMVYVGEKKLIGEVIGITDEFTTIQVYESTTGLKVGEPVYTTGAPLSATLGPGIMSNIFDGIERPLKKLEEQQGAFIDEGASLISILPPIAYLFQRCFYCKVLNIPNRNNGMLQDLHFLYLLFQGQ